MLPARQAQPQPPDPDKRLDKFSVNFYHLDVEQEFKRQFGDDFKIDVTSVENIWGNIMLRDISLSEPALVVRFGNRDLTIRKLGIEDLFLLKLDTGREKDQDDLFVLYEKTSVDALIDRFNVLWKWHGNRDAVVGYADRFVTTLSQFGTVSPREIIARLTLPDYVLQLLHESWSQLNGPAL